VWEYEFLSVFPSVVFRAGVYFTGVRVKVDLWL